MLLPICVTSVLLFARIAGPRAAGDRPLGIRAVANSARPEIP
jgi:hypothetical protein